jgi:porphobilinogen synthase
MSCTFETEIAFGMNRRPRRNRKSKAVRNLVEETSLSVKDLIFPMFLVDGSNKKIEVNSMPGIFRFSVDEMLHEIEYCMNLGISAFDVFPAYPERLKNAIASESYNPDTFYLKALRQIKDKFPEICLMSDVALDPYSSDGHDGLVKDGKILNDETLEILGLMSLAQADAGVDIIGPSDMMDGRVGFIREMLDQNGYLDTSIMSYTAKYASAFYGPFRDALDSAPKFGDKKTYQMNPANSQEALIEADLDMEEGADFLMVKPALSYLDVIKLLHDNYPVPIAAYNVSGEYSMVKAASQKGWIDGQRAMREVLLSIKRAGAKVILTYFAKEYAEFVK